MPCAGCGFEIPSDFAFCPKCGRKLPVACPSCGAPSPPEFAFCPRCGARLAAAPAAPRPDPSTEAGALSPDAPALPSPAAKTGPAAAPSPLPEADRRLVTVLFADVSGFTALGERLDPEDVRAFQSDLFREMAAAIERYEGFVEKFVGDAVMAAFGAPVAHEDDPERALRASLDMHERMRVLNRRWERRLGRALALHIGVNSGAVVAGSLGPTSGGAYAVTGDAVNTASRLQSAAQPGQTLVGPATHRFTQHAFAFERIGDVALKGKSDPLPVYLLLGALDTPRSARGLEAHGLVAPLVGRDDELAQMRAAFEGMLRGRAQVVSLVGEAGSGKSRLLSEFLAGLAQGGRLETTSVRRAECSALGEQTYGVLAALLRDAYRVAPDDTLEVTRRKLVAGLVALGIEETEAAQLASLLAYVLGLESDELRHVEPEQLKRQIFMAARALIERRLGQGPLLLVVEDLHWADAASLELLRFMVDRLADRQLMLLTAHRPTLDAGVLALNRATHTAIRLAPLSAVDSHALLRELFGTSLSRLPAHLLELVVARAGGNPFYLEEVVRGLIASGVLARDGDGWTSTADVATVDVPPTIQGLLLARLDRLPPDARRVIQEASVLGPVFDPRLLRMVSSDADACERSMELLRDAELLEETTGPGADRPTGVGPGQCRFTHALVQEVVYQNLLVSRRIDLHGRAGRALEAIYGQQPQRLEDVEALGHHFRLSDDKPRGARYLVAAGDWARAIYANADAARQYQRALETLSECEACGPERLSVRERLGDLLGPSGSREAALGHYEAVLAGYEQAGDRAAHARVYRKMGGLHWDAGERERALECFETGLTLLDGQPDHIELAYLYQEMGRLAFRSGDNQRALDWAERSLAHAERLIGGPRASPTGDDDREKEAAGAISHAHNTRGVALARSGRLEEAVVEIERSVNTATARGLLQAACRGYANLGVLYSTLDPGRAIETCLRGLETAKKIGDLGFQSRLYANLAVAYCALTDQCEEEGISAAQAAIDLDRQLGQLDHLAVPLIVLGQIHQCHGQPDRALAYYREALDLAEQSGEPQLLFPCYDGLATLHLDAGDQVRAEQYLLKAQQICEQAGLDPDSLMVLPFLC